MRKLLIMCTLFQTACATTPIVHGTPSQHARNTLLAMVSERELPGAQYVAVTADRTLLELHLGVADAATRRPMQRDTPQLAYSLTKVLTAIAVMQLVERGKLALDRPLSDYYAAHSYGTGITIRMLLAHTAGVPGPMPLDWFALESEAFDRDAKLRAVLAKNPKLDAAPGEKYLYTNLGYWLLEKAIEAASGQDYASYMREHVFDVVDVPASEASFELGPVAHAAVGHSRRNSLMNLVLWTLAPGRYWDAPAHDWSRSARLVPHGRAYGGLYCSASALARVLQDLLRPAPRLLSASARDQMFAEQRTREGERIAGGLGWVVDELEGSAYVGKQGGGLGFHGNVRIYPKLGIATVLLTNRTEITPSPIDARSDALDAGFARGPQAADTAPRR